MGAWTLREAKVSQVLGFPKIRGTLLKIPIIRTIVFRGLYWVPLFGKLPDEFLSKR